MKTFILIVMLAYPDGHTVTLPERAYQDGYACEVDRKRSEFQLGETLSVARLVAAECRTEVGA